MQVMTPTQALWIRPATRQGGCRSVLDGWTLDGGHGEGLPELERALSANRKPWKQDYEVVTYLRPSHGLKFRSMSFASSSPARSTDSAYCRMQFYPPQIATDDPGFFMASTSPCVQRLCEPLRATHVAKQGLPGVGGHGVECIGKMEGRR